MSRGRGAGELAEIARQGQGLLVVELRRLEGRLAPYVRVGAVNDLKARIALVA